jgi:hypothetical protein
MIEPYLAQNKAFRPKTPVGEYSGLGNGVSKEHRLKVNATTRER